jgi:hypothetical protein
MLDTRTKEFILGKPTLEENPRTFLIEESIQEFTSLSPSK